MAKSWSMPPSWSCWTDVLLLMRLIRRLFRLGKKCNLESSQAVAHDIVWTAGAEADLLRLYEQVGDHDLAIKVLREPLKRVLSLLAEHPVLGAKVHGTQRIRRLLTGPGKRFGIFYVVEARRIMIHVLIDMRQDPELLRLRLADL